MDTAPTAVELYRLRLPLARPFRAAHGTEHAKDVLLVRVETAEAEGWGECVATAEPTYWPEYADGAAHVIEHHLVPRVLAGRTLDDIAGHHMAKAALRSALLDARLRAEGRSLAEYLGATADRVPAGVAVGLHDSIDGLLAEVGGLAAEGYQRVKLKIQPGWDVEPVRAVRRAFPDLPLHVDANGSYETAEQAHGQLAPLDDFGLLMIEQPLPADDLLGHARLAHTLATPICLDESIGSADDAATALQLGACRVVNIKPGRVGGCDEAKRVHDLCVARGVPVWCGGMLETGVGRAVNVALAALPGFTLPGDLSASSRYFAEDVTEPFVLEDGCLRVPSGPGIGVSPRPDVLADADTSCARWAV
jgi:O-succinylbenzoate synthase